MDTAAPAPAKPKIADGAFAHAEERAVKALAAFGIVAILAMAFMTERVWGGEERVLLNPPYMVEHYGEVSFPVFANNDQPSFHRMFVHSPTHYTVIGLLMKAGVSLYYAEAIPPAAFAIFCLVLILKAGYPLEITLGWLVGFISGVGWIATVGSGDASFNLRPDAEMAFSSLAGLLVMEFARLRHWDGRWLFGGAFLMVYASTIHYSGLFGWVGIGVYMFLVMRALPWRDSLKKLAWIVGGGFSAGLPYLYFHVYRNWEYLKPWFATAAPDGQASVIKDNFAIYTGMADFLKYWPFPAMVSSFALNLLLTLAVPPFVAGLVFLMLNKNTRAIAIASLPVPLFLFFIFHRKLASYLYLEGLLMLMGFWALIALVWMKIGRRIPLKWQPLRAPALALLFMLVFTVTTPALKGLNWSVRPQQHELTLVRATAKEVVGDGEITASIHPYWYFAGGSIWYDLTTELYSQLPAEDPKAFWSRFDAIAVTGPSPFASSTGWTEGSLYEKGILRLRGFENLKVAKASHWVWLTGRKNRPVSGFFWKGNEFRKFVESPGGDYKVVSVVLPERLGKLDGFARKAGALDYWPLDLARKSGDSGWVLVMLFDSGQYHGLPDGYQPLEVVEGRAQLVNPRTLVNNFHERQDQIQFEESYPELLRHFAKATGAPGQKLEWDSNNMDIKMKDEWGALTVTANMMGGAVIVSSDARPLEPGAWYRANLDFKLDQGSLLINLNKEGDPTPVVSLRRQVPQGMTHESFVFKAPEGKTLLTVSGYYGNVVRPIRFATTPVTVERVELTR